MHDDLKRLQGTWSVTSLEVEGQLTPEAMLADARILIQGNRFTTTGMGAVYEGTLKLDPSRNPPQLDMTFEAGPEKGNTNLGIYRLDGDTWKLCLATRGTVRPGQFASPPGSGIAVETLTRGIRQQASKTAPSTAAEPTEFAGEWHMVSGVMDGKAMNKSVIKWVRRRTVGNETVVSAGPQTLMKVNFVSDSSKSPKTIDYVRTAGSHQGKTQFGIYEFEGELLKICMAATGASRPVQFQSVPGDGATFTIWRRAR